MYYIFIVVAEINQFFMFLFNRSDDDRPSDSNMHVDEDIDHNSQMAVAFDINAAVEASQPDTHPFIDVDLGKVFLSALKVSRSKVPLFILQATSMN